MFSPPKKTQIIVRILGGLGNQLFSYAAARRLALKNDAELVIDDISGFIRDYQYQRHYQLDYFHIPCRKATRAERMEPFSRTRRHLRRKISSFLPYQFRNYVQQEGVDFDPRLLSLRPQRKLYLEGYWQSEDYFKDVKLQIREDLRIIPPEDDQNQLLSRLISKKLAVAIHVRFFDDPNILNSDSQLNNNAPTDYYSRAIALMEERTSGAHYFVFSDRPNEAKRRIPLPESRMTLVYHNKSDAMAYADLWLMSQCEHFIISNSTFSWWAAWLSLNSSKIVIAPGYEKRSGLSFWGFKGLLPSAWLKC